MDSKILKILVIDDEEIVRHTLEKFLEHIGYQVECAADGLSGLAAVTDRDFDLVFVDVRMPGLNGIEFLMRSREIKPYIPVIIITGHGCEETRRESMEAGAAAFLQKPFRYNDIVEITRQMQE